MSQKYNLVKYNLKDSIFTSLFSHPEYLLQLYQTLHPEDTEATENSLNEITIKNVIVNGIHNDLGFIANGKMIILIEAQSTWSPAIVFRELEYLVKSYQDYLADTNQSKFTKGTLKLPRPELYVVYTGERGNKPDTLSLSDLWIENGFSSIDLSVKIIYYEGEKDILSQYILFTRIYDEQRKLFYDARLAIKETIHICRDKDILSSYIEKYEREAVDTMLTLYDPEAELCEHIRCEVAQGEARGEAKGKIQTMVKSVSALMERMNISKEQAMDILNITGSDAKQVSALLEHNS